MSIAQNLANIRAQLKDVTLIAVSKSHDVEAVRQALAAGQRVFGENRVQEAQKKFVDLHSDYPDIELHLIGPLQSNKAREAVVLFDVIETVDRPSLADALSAALRKTQRRPRLYIEVNIGREPQKSGILPDQLDDFYAYCQEKRDLPIEGLMCIPPHNKDPFPYFQSMRKAQQRLKLDHLSMGMSSDFVAAIACGATEVRIGTAIFGRRELT